MEWKALEKKEARCITAARHQKEPLLNRKLERFVPEKLEDTLNLAFYKAFELIFNRGTSIIEKTYRKEDMENTYKINAYAAGLKESRKTMKAFSREAGKNKSGTWPQPVPAESAWELWASDFPTYRCLPAWS